MCKPMESIIKDQFLEFLISKKIITEYQHAFIKQHYADQRVQCMQDWLLSLNSHCSTDVVNTDFSSAFDSVVLSKLMFKLERYGVSGLLLKCVSCFLHGSTQCVVVEGRFSSLVSVVGGILQG
jgi:Reverse transcriptase (RNA-dependent DNA polymerase)